jgi:hypothetical protein
MGSHTGEHGHTAGVVSGWHQHRYPLGFQLARSPEASQLALARGLRRAREALQWATGLPLAMRIQGALRTIRIHSET